MDVHDHVTDVFGGLQVLRSHVDVLFSENLVDLTHDAGNVGVDVEETARFALEVAKAFGAGTCRFYDEEEFRRLQARYGRMDRLMTLGADAV